MIQKTAAGLFPFFFLLPFGLSLFIPTPSYTPLIGDDLTAPFLWFFFNPFPFPLMYFFPSRARCQEPSPCLFCPNFPPPLQLPDPAVSVGPNRSPPLINGAASAGIGHFPPLSVSQASSFSGDTPFFHSVNNFFLGYAIVSFLCWPFFMALSMCLSPVLLGP